jgi:lipopolysaccharide biosynthesis glycosyltransferase
MSKTLVYTVSNFTKDTNRCTDLLVQSIKLHNTNFDFCVMSDTEPPQKYPYNTVVDKGHAKYIPKGKEWAGLTRYSDLLPKNYDHYIYFDSDVLCFAKLNEIFPPQDKVISVATEYISLPDVQGNWKEIIRNMSDIWYCYPAATPEEKLEMTKYLGFNVGVMGFKNLDVHKQVKAYIDNVLIDMIHSAKDPHSKIYSLDQTPLNYFCFKNMDKVHDIHLQVNNFTRCTRLHNKKALAKSVNIFHFTGIDQGMAAKAYHMENFWEHREANVHEEHLL